MGPTLHLSRNLEINDSWSYIIWIFIFTFLIRVILSMFKCAAIRQGEADEEEKYKFSHFFNSFALWRGRWEAFWVSFWSSGHHRNLDDYFLPALIGTIELFAYPILMVENKWVIIGAWMTIKTAVQWHKWAVSRTPYNRFLLANLLVLVLSYFFLTKFISKDCLATL